MRSRKPAKEPSGDSKGEQTIGVWLDKALLKRCTALARKKRITLDTLISRGIRALLAAEGE